MNILFNKPIKNNLSIRSVSNILKLNRNIHGPGQNYKKIQNFVKKKYGFDKTFLTNSCTAALEICALSIDIKPGDEVILPSYSFITTGSSFARSGANLIYCDIETENLMPSYQKIKKLINSKTKAIVILHYQGFSVDYLYKLKTLCKRKNIYLIEDAAQSLGSKLKNKYLGKFGDLACFSFHYTKNIHTGSGGMLVVNNKKLLKKISYVYDKGTNRADQISGKIKYYSWVTLGSNFLMTELHASYLIEQLRKYHKVISYRKRIYKNYLKYIKYNYKFKLIIKNKYLYNYHALVLYCKMNKAQQLINYLNKFKIQAFIGYYPLHLSRKGREYFRGKKFSLINTENAFKRIVRLPLHTDMQVSQVKYISSKINEFFH